MTIGGPERIPKTSEILDILNDPGRSLNVNFLGIPLADRPSFFQEALARIQELRFKTGQPHWVVIDEAHHVLPAELTKAGMSLPQEIKSFLVVTTRPELLSPSILKAVTVVMTVGPEPGNVIRGFSQGTARNVPEHCYAVPLQPGQVLIWCLENEEEPKRIRVEPATTQRRRHRRKYAAGELGEDKSFYFRGPDGKLNLRAQNMNLFAQIAEGLDEATWKFHLSNGDYSRWLQESIKDDELAKIVAEIETNKSLQCAIENADMQLKNVGLP